jgi:Protein of unknown function (DUF3892)
MARQITCILTTSREHHEHIVRVGGTGFNISREDCADDIRTGRESYFTMGGGMRAQVEAYQLRVNGSWYIRTVPDATRKDNLLSLPDCR